MSLSNTEIGGYLSLEHGNEPLYHSNNAIYLNSARNALRFIIRQLNITEIALPYYTCEVVWESLLEEGCKLHFYDIDKQLQPIVHELPEHVTILCNNYFGIQTTFIKEFTKFHPNTIVDNAQAFYSPHYGLASIYSPRKFFGLPDGGIAVTEKCMTKNIKLEQDTLSYQRCSHLLKRIDLGANAAYTDFSENDKSLENEPIKKISQLTMTLMSNINYDRARIIRRQNFSYLHNQLQDLNLLKIKLDDIDVPLAYPLLIENEELRAFLIKNKVYVAKYWPNIETIAPSTAHSLFLQKHLIPLPIDQRYGDLEMKKIIDTIKNYLG